MKADLQQLSQNLKIYDRCPRICAPLKSAWIGYPLEPMLAPPAYKCTRYFSEKVNDRVPISSGIRNYWSVAIGSTTPRCMWRR